MMSWLMNFCICLITVISSYCLVKASKNKLSMIIIIEIMFLWFIYSYFLSQWNSKSLIYFFIMMIVLAVLDSCLSISILVSYSRSNSKSFFFNFNF